MSRKEIKPPLPEIDVLAVVPITDSSHQIAKLREGALTDQFSVRVQIPGQGEQAETQEWQLSRDALYMMTEGTYEVDDTSGHKRIQPISDRSYDVVWDALGIDG